MPDCLVIPEDDIWPSIPLEIGYSETYEQLKGDVNLLLEGSQGRIRVVILVKISPLGPRDTCCQTGPVEIHNYDNTSGTKKERDETKGNFCGNMDLLLRRPVPPSPPLMLDALLECVDVGLGRQLIAGQHGQLL
ncbi:hypothetical protein BDW42DRAFT_169391 [Aspergillus taichungensis]|uniref:Uncharacterized protein n=1 Tax=Aspergillus taichungensis TaxID=482145 RepID=A0A2J5HV07_9EURO|nr:hypothetical protein BDW42DRAFT_169391 [Aspergillus taichungensis]